MRIGIDARLIRYKRGMGNLTFNLIQALATLPTTHDFLFYLDRPPAQGALPDAFAAAARVIGPAPYPIWEQLALVHHVQRDRVDVLHCPNNTAPIAQLGSTRLVLTIHDVIYLLPSSEVPTPTSHYQRLGHHYRRWTVPRAARHAESVITDSEYSRQDLVRLLGLPDARVEVVQTGPGPEFRRLPNLSGATATLELHGIRQPYVLGLAASDPRKNVHALIRSFSKLKGEGTPLQLVLAGSGPKDSAVWQAEASRLNIRNDVRTPGFVSPTELVDLYNLAEFFVFPSLYEGFGLPVVEAMACGTPVIASNRSSIPEVAGGAALLAEPTVEGLGSAMRILSRDKAVRKSLAQAGLARVSKYSWARTAAEMVKIYEGKA